MPKILSARRATLLLTSDLNALILRAECVAKDLIAMLPVIPPEDPWHTALTAAAENPTRSIEATEDAMWCQITRPELSNPAPTFGQLADSCGYNDGAQT